MSPQLHLLPQTDYMPHIDYIRLAEHHIQDQVIQSRSPNLQLACQLVLHRGCRYELIYKQEIVPAEMAQAYERLCTTLYNSLCSILTMFLMMLWVEDSVASTASMLQHIQALTQVVVCPFVELLSSLHNKNQLQAPSSQLHQ